MTLYLGLDIATKTGWALYPDNQIRAIRTGTFKAVGESYEEKSASLARQLSGLIQKHGRPDFCMIEQPQRNVQPQKKAPSKMFPGEDAGMTINAGTALLLNQLVGSAVGILIGYSIPFDVVAVQRWRKCFFPDGWKGTDRADWKRLAKKYCDTLKIEVSNADEAEAVGIVAYTKNSPKFQMLKYEAQKQSAA